jgi:DNA invertase Pin-like site-specific DNA recombinase
MMKENTISLKYCLYARKSSESDERQAMSIDSQVKEMSAIAVRDGIEIVDIKRESHSAKNSGTRPLLLEMLYELTIGKYNAILTWAPDRLSRNAGDLGSLVDLMDKGKLAHIKTSSQSFSNNPNEKFLLMILCSQAKLENDNRGLNVKRGIRAKCEMGWRPAPAPIGYLNYSHLGTKKVMLDKEIAPLIKEMFVMLVNGGFSGRDIKDWIDKDDRIKKHTQRNIPLSMVYRMLKNPFYYGEFEYPEGSDKWYKGSHEPIITKELFMAVQRKLDQYTHNKSKTGWGSKTFDLKNVFKCAYCGANVIGEEKFKQLKSGKKNRHVYYHCSKKIDPNCPEPYVNEIDLIDKFIQFIEFIERKKLNFITISNEVKFKTKKYKAFRDQVLLQQNVAIEDKPLKFSDYFKHIIQSGNDEEKQEMLKCIQQPLYLHNGDIFINPLI